VFVVDTTGGLEACVLGDELRRAGITAERAFENRSMKSQMKVADRSGASVAVIVGSDEVAAAEVTVRDLRGGSGQARVPRTELIDHLHKRLS
jgi:histidyl-tRNA synthetase